MLNVSGLSVKLDLVYLSAFALDSVSSDTSTNVGSDPWSAMNALTSVCAPIKLSLLIREKIEVAHNALFKVPAKRKSQKLILVGRIETEPVACESSGGNSESSQFFHYGQKSRHMMERMGYDFIKKSGLNFGKEKRALLRSFVPKGKDPDYYHMTRRGLGYVTTLVSSDFESEKRSIMTAHQQRHCGTQMSVLVMSSKVSQLI